jgi:polyferredoxin
MAAVSYFFILSSLWGTPVGNHNITIIFVWIFWWFLLKAVFVPLGGRFCCTVCPLPTPAEWLSRKALTAAHTIEKPLRGLRHSFLGLQLDWPKKLRNLWLQNMVFMAMISFGIMLITRPIATGMAFLLILVVTIVLVALLLRLYIG